MEAHTPEEVTEAYEKLLWAQGLVDFALRSGFDMREEVRAETEGSLISIFSILQDYLKRPEEILFDLDNGKEQAFIKIWKNKE